MTKATRPPKPPAPERPRGGAARAVADLLPDIGRTAFRKFGFVQSSVITRWTEIVGEKYARVSAPESIRFPQGERSGGVLSLVVVGAYVTMMQHIAPEIIERVNRFFGYPAVAKVAFRAGDVSRPKQLKAVADSAPRPLSPELGDGLRAIVDPELKSVLEGLAAGIERPGALPQGAIPKIGRIE